MFVVTVGVFIGGVLVTVVGAVPDILIDDFNFFLTKIFLYFP